MGELLALASAVCYGVVDLDGGLLARRAGFARVAFAGQLGALVLTLLVAPVVSPGLPAGRRRSRRAVSGACTGRYRDGYLAGGRRTARRHRGDPPPRPGECGARSRAAQPDVVW